MRISLSSLSLTSARLGVIPALQLVRGYLSNYDAGLTANLIASPTAPGGGSGTLGSPMTLAEAVAAATPGQTIALRGGTYRASATLPAGTAGNIITLKRYGSEIPIIDGSETLSGLALCTSGDEAVVGPNWASIYKATVNTADISGSDPRAAFIHEAGVPLPPAMSWKGSTRPLLINNIDKYHDATTTLTSADPTPTAGRETFLLGFRNLAITAGLTKAQVENAQLMGMEYPNVGFRVPCLFDAGTGDITINDGATEHHYEANSKKDKFALVNLLPAMKQGQWGYKDNGNGTTTLYVWPNSAANVTSGISYARRGLGVKLASYTTLDGIEFRGHASFGASTDDKYPISAGGVTKKYSITVSNCRVHSVLRNNADYGAIWLGNVDDWTVRDTSVDMTLGCYGMFLQGSTADRAKRGLLANVVVKDSEQSPFRLYSQEQCLVTKCWAVGYCGVGAHANKTNFYEGCDRVVYLGNYFGGASGYLTWQETSRIGVIGNWMATSFSGTDGRAINDQNNATDTPAVAGAHSGASYILRNTVVPYVGAIANTNSISLGKSDNPEVTYTVRGNWAHGIIEGFAGAITAQGDNVLTSGTSVPGTLTGGANIVTSAGAMYVDHAAGDFTVKGDAPARTQATADYSADIATVKGWLPANRAVWFDTDLLGSAVNWAAAPSGALVDRDAELTTAPTWIDDPALSGVAITGNVLSANSGFLMASPFVAATYEWRRGNAFSQDPDKFTAIAGATGASYTAQVADEGKYLGRLTSAGSAQAFAAFTTAAAASFPIGAPSLAVVSERPANGTQFESDTFTGQNRPMLVTLSARTIATTAETYTITIGAPARAYGTGTVIASQKIRIRTTTQTVFAFIAAPGTGSQTIQVQTAGTTEALNISATYWDGATGLGAAGDAQGTANDLTASLTTTASNSVVVYSLNRSNGGSLASPTYEGATLFGQSVTASPGDSRDLMRALLHEQAPSVGSYSARVYNASWSIATMLLAAVELTS